MPFPGMYGRAMEEDRGGSTACLLQRAKVVERAVGEKNSPQIVDWKSDADGKKKKKLIEILIEKVKRRWI